MEHGYRLFSLHLNLHKEPDDAGRKKSPVTFTKNDVEIIARETVYDGFFSVVRYRFRHRQFNGEMSGEVQREVFERGHAAVLLPYDPLRDEVVLIEQSASRLMTAVFGPGCWRWSPALLSPVNLLSRSCAVKPLKKQD